MNEALFDIYYLDGLKPGVSASAAAQRLSGLTGLSEQQSQLLIGSPQRVVKHNLSKDHAVRYLTALEKVGMQVEIRPAGGKSVSPAAVKSALDLDEEISEAVKRKQLSESTHNYDRSRK